MVEIRYPIPAEEVEHELMVSNSRFIASAAPAFTVDMARQFIQLIRQRYPDATHHVPAFLVGFGASVIAHCGDDGEPSGTAGRPALAVLQGSGLGDVVVVVTRYFGGTKLGTGGLVRAYTDAVKGVVQRLPRAERIPTYTVMTTIPYPLFERVRLLCAAHLGKILDEEFGADVTLTLQFAVDRFQMFQSDLTELSRGSVEVVIMEHHPDTIMPLGSMQD